MPLKKDELKDNSDQNLHRVSKLVENYESNLSSNNLSEFSASDFSNIIDYYSGSYKIKEAFQTASLAVKQFPDNTALLLNISSFYINLKRFEKAVPLIRRSLELNPESYEAKIQMANIYDGWGETEKALEYIEEILLQHPENIETLLTSKYSILLNNNRYKEAIPILKYLLELNFDHPLASYELLNSYEAIGRPEKAIDFYESLVDKDPYNYKLWNNLGFLYTLLHDDDKAIHAYELSLAINNNIPETSYCLGNIYSNNEDFAKSIEFYHKAIDSGGEDDLVYMELGFAYLNSDKIEESIISFKKSIELYPEGHDSWFGLGMAYEGKGLYRKTLVYLKHAIRLYPENGKYWYELGNAFANLSKNRLAIKAYRRAVKYTPSLIDAWIDMVLLLSDDGLKETALTLLNKGIAKNKSSADLLYIKAGIMIENNDALKGENILEKALKLNPYISYILFEHFPNLHKNSMVKQIIQSYEN